MKTMKRITISISAEADALLDTIAARDMRSRGAVVEILLRAARSDTKRSVECHDSDTQVCAPSHNSGTKDSAECDNSDTKDSAECHNNDTKDSAECHNNDTSKNNEFTTTILQWEANM